MYFRFRIQRGTIALFFYLLFIFLIFILVMISDHFATDLMTLDDYISRTSMVITLDSIARGVAGII